MREPLERPISRTWFLERPKYRRFMLREMTAAPIAAYVVFLVIWIGRVASGHADYAALVSVLKSPVSVMLHLGALAGALTHSITWFKTLPQALPLRKGEDRMSNAIILFGAGYVPWIVVSALILWIVV